MTYIVPHYIAGQSIIEPTEKKQVIYNPARDLAIGSVYFANTAICNNAVAAAKKAGTTWAQTPITKRAHILFKFRELLEQNHSDLARLITTENGKTHDDAKGSVARAIEAVEYYCGLVKQLEGSVSTNISHQIDCATLRQPLGVCAGVSPFNFPVMVPVWMMIPAIACGNTFILKPSEQDPSAPIRLMELLSDAGLPDGVANCVQGDKTTVEQLLHHPDIMAFTAVASTTVAKSIYTTATSRGIRAHTFGGAKNHAVVMPDADLEQTANAIVGAAFGSAGERCMAISVVVIVGTETANKLIDLLTPLIHKMKIDEGNIPGCDMGPLISKAHRERVLNAINQGVEEGAELLIDGRTFQHPIYPQGYFIGPSLFDNVTESMNLYQQEIFGPVLTIVRVTDFEQALLLVNRHQYGNGTAIFTHDGFTAREYAQRVHAGMVGINIPIPVPITSHPFGGWKNSVFGDTNMHGNESFNFYTQRKTITSKWLAPHHEFKQGTNTKDNTFVMPTHR